MIFWDYLLIVGIVMFILGVLVWLFRYDWGEDLCAIVILVGFMVVSLSFTTPRMDYTEVEVTNEYALWSCDAPYGRYWVDTEGTLSFLWGSIDSTLVESYTLKYLVGDELKTLILSSTAENVHLHLTVNLSMTFEEIQLVRDYQIGPSREMWEPEYHIYVPDPKLMEVEE